VIHYHGTPLTPRPQLLRLLGRNFCVPFPDPRDLVVCHEIGQSVMLDNGAFTFWKQNREPESWDPFYEWVEPWLDFHTTWAVIPDVIEGDEAANDVLLGEWPFGVDRGAPVWHMHESIERLVLLAEVYPRVCIGSSAQYAEVATPSWHARMTEAMDALCGDGPPPCWLHMLRGMKLSGGPYPFASVDSTGIARNHGGNNTRATPPKDVVRMADDFDAVQCPARWRVSTHEQLALS
jgi:hypothetical protein